MRPLVSRSHLSGLAAVITWASALARVTMAACMARRLGAGGMVTVAHEATRPRVAVGGVEGKEEAVKLGQCGQAGKGANEAPKGEG